MRKKRDLILFLLAAAVILLVCSRFAIADSSVFSGEVKPGYEYSTSSGDRFSVAEFGDQEKLVVDFESESIAVENQSCNTGYFFKVCYDGGKFSGYNYSLPGRVVYSYTIDIYSFSPELTITQPNEISLQVGQKEQIGINITNEGSGSATIHLSETIPEELKLFELPNQICSLSANNTLILTAEVKPGQTKQCNFKVQALAPGSYPVSSTLREDSSNKVISEITNVFVEPLPLIIVISSTQGNLNLSETALVNFSLDTTEPLDSFAFSGFFPLGLNSVLKTKDATCQEVAEGYEVNYKKNFIQFKNSTTIEVEITATKVGQSIITAHASWIRNITKQEITVSLPINVTSVEPYLRLMNYDNNKGTALIDLVNFGNLTISKVMVSSKSFQDNPGFDEIGKFSHASFEVVALPGSNISATISYSSIYGQKLQTVSKISIPHSAKAIENQPAEPTPTQVPSTIPAQDSSAQDPPPAANEQTSSDNPNAAPIIKNNISPKIQIGFGFGFAILAVILVVMFFVARKKSLTA
jgi:hypothetical protein